MKGKNLGLTTKEAPELIEIGGFPSIGQTLGELSHHRELLYFLVWKDIKVKYKQTMLGIAWAIVQPLLGMVLFTLLFGRVAQLPSDGLPYPLFITPPCYHGRISPPRSF